MRLVIQRSCPLAWSALAAAGLLAADAESAQIYWAEDNSDKVFGANAADGSGQTEYRDLDDTFFGERGYTINGLAFFNNRLYITDGTVDRIFFVNVNNGVRGTRVNLDSALGNADYRPRGIAANATHLYWGDANTDKIYRSNLNGSGAQELIDISNNNPSIQGIEVRGNDLYWTHTLEDAVYRSDLDGSNVTSIVQLDSAFGDANYNPGFVAASQDWLFWSDTVTGVIYRADRDGANPIELIDLRGQVNDRPTGLVTDGSRLYWTDFSEDGIYVADLDGNILANPAFTPPLVPGETVANINRLAIEYVPEPSSLALFALGGLIAARRRRCA